MNVDMSTADVEGGLMDRCESCRTAPVKSWAASDIIKFLPSYTGSKRQWVSRLEFLQGRHFVELFSGSAVLSANLAQSALLVDTDPHLTSVLQRFDELVIPENFSRCEYYQMRTGDWWRNLYCLQSVSYSGVLRHSKNGYNVPIKGGQVCGQEKNSYDVWSVKAGYAQALTRWLQLAPQVVCGSYLDVSLAEILDRPYPVVVLDPPYEGSQTPYNGDFDYGAYWDRAREISARVDVVVFDDTRNLEGRGLHGIQTRKMRVNGSRPGSEEGMVFVPAGRWGK